MAETSVVQPTRKLRLLGDGLHGETQVAGRLANHAVEQEPFDLVNSYRNTYVLGVYADPEAARVADYSSVDTPACPCSSTF